MTCLPSWCRSSSSFGTTPARIIVWERFYELEDVHYAMIEEIALGESAPQNATVFVMEFIRRVTGGRAS